MIKDSDGQVFVCDERGERKFKFKQAEDWVLMNMSISDNNDIMIISHDRSVVETYSLSEGNLKLTKEYSEGHKAMQVAFHPKTCQITVFAYVHDQERDWWFSFRYSEDGDPESNVPLFQLKDPEKYWWKENINIIPREAVAVAMGKNMIFI
jgi:protease II